MEDCSEFVLKKLCCTCLNRDRKLLQLCRLKDGINNLYLLLSQDSKAYREGFFRDAASWHICWECWAIMRRIRSFQNQVCVAQRQLSDIAEGRTNPKLLNTCLSQLTYTHKSSYDLNIVEPHSITDNFIDCGPDFISESDEDIPLSLLHNKGTDNIHSDNESKHTKSKKDFINKPLSEKGLRKTADSFKKKQIMENDLHDSMNKEYFSITKMNDVEMNESRAKRKIDILNMLFKCEPCVEVFENQIEFDRHILELHIKKDNHMQCDICLVYVKESMITSHRDSHYIKYKCKLCEYNTYTTKDIFMHFQNGHGTNSIDVSTEELKTTRRTRKILRDSSKISKNQPVLEKKTAQGYACMECNEYFVNKNQKWKHMQRTHREGYKCPTCGKRFAFKNILSKHEMLHTSPPPREKCPICQKMVRIDHRKIHARIHAQRDRFKCLECDKCFVSRASYEHHLKYTQAHTAMLKYKCSLCDKGYRSDYELRDHVNYHHMDKTQHKCPICGKALATRRGITRHVRSAHDGVKENARDKICQQCGKAFRDKKGLREHEFIHTGERPLSCEICGCTFRQSASLYTHKKRVHKIFPSRKNVTLVDEIK